MNDVQTVLEHTDKAAEAMRGIRDAFHTLSESLITAAEAYALLTAMRGTVGRDWPCPTPERRVK